MSMGASILNKQARGAKAKQVSPRAQDDATKTVVVSDLPVPRAPDFVQLDRVFPNDEISPPVLFAIQNVTKWHLRAEESHVQQGDVRSRLLKLLQHRQLLAKELAATHSEAQALIQLRVADVSPLVWYSLALSDGGASKGAEEVAVSMANGKLRKASAMRSTGAVSQADGGQPTGRARRGKFKTPKPEEVEQNAFLAGAFDGASRDTFMRRFPNVLEMRRDVVQLVDRMDGKARSRISKALRLLFVRAMPNAPSVALPARLDNNTAFAPADLIHHDSRKMPLPQPLALGKSIPGYARPGSSSALTEAGRAPPLQAPLDRPASVGGRAAMAAPPLPSIALQSPALVRSQPSTLFAAAAPTVPTLPSLPMISATSKVLAVPWAKPPPHMPLKLWEAMRFLRTHKNTTEQAIVAYTYWIDVLLCRMELLHAKSTVNMYASASALTEWRRAAWQVKIERLMREDATYLSQVQELDSQLEPM